ncbi:MAG TPA: radical SAM protein [Allosphingosinicella sp.]|jgi:MoaA/NifB/PqqE/SkfB family radical SAM enzyme
MADLNLPELDLPPEHGLIMKGWDFSQAEVAAAVAEGRVLNPAIELCSNVCPWNCDFCFTEYAFAPKKRKLASELSFEQRVGLLEALAALGARSINIVGAGEPTIDPYFFDLLDAIAKLGMQALVYTEGSLKLSDKDFCRRVYDSGATVVLKVNSLWQEEYQNSILVSGNTKPHTPKFNYFQHRQQAIENMMELGFNAEAPTRLAFDTIICRENAHEIERLHRFARRNNIFILLVNYLPSGRSASGHTNALSRAEQFETFARLAEIDRREYGIEQRGIFPYAGSQPCLIRGTGVFVKINGDVLACPGETRPVGNFLKTGLATVWERLRDVRGAFDGHCPPRERFWKVLAEQDLAAAL